MIVLSRSKLCRLFCLLIMSFCLLFIIPCSIKIYGQSLKGKQVSGLISDTSGIPLAGVSIVEKGTSNGTKSNTDGTFKLKFISSNSSTLVISSIGYESTEITVTSEDIGSITLKSAEKKLDDVIVIGYGTTTRKLIAGAVDQISSKNIENRPVGNIMQALQGAAPSLVIQQRSMDPNSNTMNINIRGVNTLTSANPLVVIDGMISDLSNMNRLNPNDISNISVLKDAGTAAIYGSRAASGVIVITTKKGVKNSEPKFRLGAATGSQTADILYKPLKGWQNATMLNIALANSGQNPAYTPAEIQDLKDHTDAPWMMDYIFKNSLQQQYDASVSGGSENTIYNVSAGYYGQQSNFIGPGYGARRYSIRANLTTEYKRLKFNLILGYVRSESKGDQANAGFKIADASRTPNYYYNIPKTDDGRYLISSVGTSAAAGLELAGYNKPNNDWISVGTNLELKITNDLKARAVFGYDLNSGWNFVRNFQYLLYNNMEDTIGHIVNTDRNTENYSNKNMIINSQFLLDYNKHFGKHTITAMLGVSQEVTNNKNISVITKFTDSALGIPISGETTFDQSRTEVNGTSRSVIQSVFGRLNYNYDSRYTAEFTIRKDGSTRFPKGSQWKALPSVSLGWTLSEEAFMKTYKEHIGSAKIRGSWGTLGNQDIDDYQYLTTYTIYSNIAGFNNTITPGTGFRDGNPNIVWEKVISRNIGADLSFLNNKLNVSVDYFNNKTTDILLKPILPTVYGTTAGFFNIGSMQNRGWEININYNFRTSDFAHAVSFNIGNTQNKALGVGNPYIATSDGVGYIRQNGLPLGGYFGLKTNGLFQSYDEIDKSAIPIGVSPQPGDVKYIDMNKDGVIDDNDRTYLGDGFPHYNFGFTYNLNYKGFDLSVLIQGVGKRLQSLRGDIYTPFHNGAWYPIIFQHELDTWTVTNTDARFPRLTASGSSSFSNNWGRGASDISILNAKYIRVKNIQIGYRLPTNLVNKIGIKGVRAYINVQNPFTFSKNSFIDPESTEFGNRLSETSANSGRNYPTLKYYGGGINIDL